MKIQSLLIALLFVLASATPALHADDQETTRAQPKVIILMIGDGMGHEYLDLARTTARTSTGNHEVQLHMDRLPVRSQLTTKLHGKYITDSAASGTAFACGEHHHMNAVSVGRNKKTPLPTIVDQAQFRSWKIGLITTVSLDHATPACFYAHEFDRNKYEVIASQLLESKIDFIGGGGLRATEKGFKITTEEAAKHGYSIVRNNPELLNATGARRILAMSANLAQNASMPDHDEEESIDYNLPTLVNFSLDFLKNDNGILLIVEGGKIDWYGHENKLKKIANQTLGFDEAVGKALAYYNKHPEETLLIVTSDHETGDLKFNKDWINKENPYGFRFHSTKHSGKKVPLLAIGPGSELFAKEISNVEAGQLLFKLIGGKKVKAPPLKSKASP